MMWYITILFITILHSCYSQQDVVCREEPIIPVNSILKCNSRFSSCNATCRENYEFPNGQQSLMMICNNNKWELQSSARDPIPDCLPICSPSCKNGGLCITPNVCACKREYNGRSCENYIVNCIDFPPIPMNSRRYCTSKECFVRCFEGYELPDKTSTTNITCKNGSWVPKNPSWRIVPDCQAICEPRCMNGGRCWAPNQCECEGDYKGQYCQFKCERDTPRLPLNSRMSCSIQGNCTATCYEGHKFPNNINQLKISCGVNGWQTEFGSNVIPNCEPLCNPDCGYNGKCVGPNECLCDAGFTGLHCQVENRQCDMPLTPANSMKSCNSRRCLIRCLPGFKFNDGTNSDTINCVNGNWVPTNKNWSTVPPCIPE